MQPGVSLTHACMYVHVHTQACTCTHTGLHPHTHTYTCTSVCTQALYFIMSLQVRLAALLFLRSLLGSLQLLVNFNISL